MRIEILLDIDGVAANFIEGCRPEAERLTGRSVHHDDVDQFMIEAALGLDAEQTKALYAQVMQEGWCRSLPAYEYAKECVAEISKRADVVPVTSHYLDSKTWVWERDEWIVEHLGIPKTNVIHTHRKFQVDGDVLIDDKPSHLRMWWDRRPAKRAVLFERRYNVRDDWCGLRASSWPALLALLKEQFEWA